MESLVQNYKGNNPHTGKGDYDLGQDYLDKYKQIFKNVIDTDKLENVDEETKPKIETAGFGKIIKSEDNDKCSVVEMEFLPCGNEIEVQSEKESYQVINIKNMIINFYTNGDEDFKQYIKTTVMPYLEMMIPSTTIFEVLFDGEESCLDK